MVEKTKIKEINVLNVLDDIGCGCGSCEEEHSHETTTEIVEEQVFENPLDDIGCG